MNNTKLEKFFCTLSLKDKEDRFTEIVNNSLFAKIFHSILTKWESFIKDISRDSFFAKFSEIITLISIMLLVFSLPFVSTGVNGALVIFAVLATTMKHLLKPETIPKKVDILTFTLLLYFAIALIAVCFSPYFILALKGYAKMLIFLLAYFVFLVNLTNIKNIRWVIWSIIISASIVSLYGIYQFIIKVEPYQGALWDDPNAMNYKTTRVYSFLKNPNLLAGYLIPTIAFTSMFFYINKGWKKIIVAMALFLQLSCIYFTYSRGGWIGVLGIAMMLCFGTIIIYWKNIISSKFWKTSIILAIILFFVGIIAIIILSPSTLERITSIFTIRGHSSNSFRMNVWIASFKMFQDSIFIGYGTGNDLFNRIYPLYMFSNFKALSAYNIFLETAVETGLIGLIIFTFTLFLHSCRSVWGIIANISYSSKIILMGCFVCLTGMVFHGMVDTVWYRPQVQILFMLSLAIITIVSRDEISLEKTDG